MRFVIFFKHLGDEIKQMKWAGHVACTGVEESSR
jgi:hypothetical protein